MIISETKSGFKFEVDERALEDWGIINAIKKYDKAVNPVDKADIVPELVNMLLGKKAFEKLEKHVRAKNDGFCTITKLQEEIFDILSSANVKN